MDVRDDRSLRYNGLFRSFSNYRVDNKGFDLRKPARPLGLYECFHIGGEMEEWTKLKKDETRKHGVWKENGKKRASGKKKTKKDTHFNWMEEI